MATFLTTGWLRRGVAVVLFIAVTAIVPRWWCAREGERWFAGNHALSLGLSRTVADNIKSGVTTADFTSNSSLFRHEWQFGTYQMGALGLLQVCHLYPERSPEFMPAVEQAIDRLLSHEVRDFDGRQWGQDPLDALEGDRGHAAYLGYLNLALAVHRRCVANSRFANLNDRISAALVRRFQANPARAIETYPGESYPVDIAAGLGSLLLWTGANDAQRACIASALEHYRADWRDPRTGLLYQAIDPRDGKPLDAARASGTALAAYFLSFGGRDVARRLYESLRTYTAGSALGFGYVSEYPSGVQPGKGDIDSGPLCFGISPSASGFMLGTARIMRDRDTFVALSRSLYLVGTPARHGDRYEYAMGGPLGNSIMLAMLTANREMP